MPVPIFGVFGVFAVFAVSKENKRESHAVIIALHTQETFIRSFTLILHTYAYDMMPMSSSEPDERYPNPLSLVCDQ